ncbi:unnamed protein product, partial [Amoebophrya sp. A25]
GPGSSRPAGPPHSRLGSVVGTPTSRGNLGARQSAGIGLGSSGGPGSPPISAARGLPLARDALGALGGAKDADALNSTGVEPNSAGAATAAAAAAKKAAGLKARQQHMIDDPYEGIERPLIDNRHLFPTRAMLRKMEDEVISQGTEVADVRPHVLSEERSLDEVSYVVIKKKEYNRQSLRLLMDACGVKEISADGTYHFFQEQMNAGAAGAAPSASAGAGAAANASLSFGNILASFGSKINASVG